MLRVSGLHCDLVKLIRRHEVGIDAGALDEGLVGAVEEVRCLGVFEATLSALCDGGTECASYDNLLR